MENNYGELSDIVDDNAEENPDYDGKSEPGDKQLKFISYNMPGVLHFLQNEWYKFDNDRIVWEKEKSEMKAKISFQETELLLHKQMNHHLLRRIKMLELKLFNDSNPTSSNKKLPVQLQANQETTTCPTNKIEENNLISSLKCNTFDDWLKNNSLLKHYFNEIEAIDNLIIKRRENTSIPLLKNFNSKTSSSNICTSTNSSKSKPTSKSDTNEGNTPIREIIKAKHQLKVIPDLNTDEDNDKNTEMNVQNKILCNEIDDSSNNNYEHGNERSMTDDIINDSLSKNKNETTPNIKNNTYVNDDLEFLDNFLDNNTEI